MAEPIDWAYPFHLKALVTDGASADTYYRALARAKDGFYPIDAGDLWHGGIHFDDGSAEVLDQSAVYCIADGEVVAYRIDRRYPSSRHGEKQLPFSSGFVLVRHRLTLPTARNAASTTLRFYSLYMHLLDWAGYSSAGAPTLPAFFSQSLQPDSPAAGEKAPPLDSVHVLPQPYPLKAGELIGHIGQYQTIDDALPRALLHLEVFTCEDAPAFLKQSRAFAEQLSAEHKSLIAVNPGAKLIQTKVADTQIPADPDLRLSSDSPSEGRWAKVRPYAVLKVDRAALGRYQPAARRYAVDDTQRQALAAQLGIDLNRMPTQVDFLLQSYSSPGSQPLQYRSNRPIPASHPLRKIGIALEPPLWVERRTLNDQGQRGVSSALAAWTTFPLDPDADGVPCGHVRILPSSAWRNLAPAHKAIGPDLNPWWYLTLGGRQGQDISGWVAEIAPAVSTHSPWAWPGFSTLPSLDATLDGLYQAMDLANRDHQLTSTELATALGKPWLAQRLALLISQHKSAWLLAQDRPAATTADEPRDLLAWWHELLGQPAIAADGLAWHFHAIGLISLFKRPLHALIWLRRVQELYGASLAERFRAKVIAVGENLQIDPNHIMACIALETGRTFNPAIKNPRSSATGLIQFMASTAKALGTTTGQLARMGHVEQMDYVEKYFLMTARNVGVPTSAWSLGDLYFSIFTPSVIKKRPTDPVYVKGQRAYAVNMFHDRDKDGVITKQEIAENIHDYFNAGFAYLA